MQCNAMLLYVTDATDATAISGSDPLLASSLSDFERIYRCEPSAWCSMLSAADARDSL